MNDNEDQIISDLILSGALEIAGIDMETGEPLYNFTQKLIDINPELHNEMSTYFSQEAMALWQHGFISMDVTEKNPVVKLLPKAFDREEVEKLDKNHQYSLKERYGSKFVKYVKLIGITVFFPESIILLYTGLATYWSKSSSSLELE
jgi:hypothetical protein